MMRRSTTVATSSDKKTSHIGTDDDPSNEDLDPIIAHATDRNGQVNSNDAQLTILKKTRQRNPLARLGRIKSNSTDNNKKNDTDDVHNLNTPEACEKIKMRLQGIIDQLGQNGDISISALQNTLESTIEILDAIRNKKSRESTDEDLDAVEGLIKATSSPSGPSRIESNSPIKNCVSKPKSPALRKKQPDEDDELSEVQPDAVPNEVREWLASTFTRQAGPTRRRTVDKPRFRSVANAIRAGIFVDRIYRRMASSVGPQIPSNVAVLLKRLDDWSFDVFAVNDASNGQCLKFICNELLSRYGLIHKFKIPMTQLENFLSAIETGYTKNKNPYHNNIHAADVTQTVHFMIWQTGIMNWLTDLEVLSVLVAAVIHDFEHSGTTNNFHVMSGSHTALLYNDRSVLENHHISSAFQLLITDENNFLNHLSPQEYREFRSLVIEMVLCTDMSSHFQQIKTMKNILTSQSEEGETSSNFLDKSRALSLVLHCSDISHPAKEWKLHHRWTDRLLEEFFRQGDKEQELGLPYSPLCDRKSTLVAESQIGFIDFIVDPSLQVCGDMLDKILALQAKDNAPPTPIESKDTTKIRARSVTSLPGRSCQSLSLSAEPFSTPASPRSPITKRTTTVPRSWEPCLARNKTHWKECAIQDAAVRAEKKKQEQENGGKIAENEGRKEDSET